MKYILALALLTFGISISAQGKLNPVQWTFEVEDKGDHYLLVSSANIDKSWSLYSQHTDQGGPVPLSFNYESEDLRIGETLEKSKAEKKFSKLFEVNVSKFKTEAIFHQKFTKQKDLKSIKGELKYMCCDDLRCLPPTFVEFDVKI